MRITQELYYAMEAALRPFLAQGAPMTERDRWDLLWRSGFDTRQLYDAGLNDQHIDTALRRIVGAQA
jgi:hypothetical protein